MRCCRHHVTVVVRHTNGSAMEVEGDLAALPSRWRKHLRRQLRKGTTSVSAEGAAADTIAVGARNSTLFAMASSWRAKGDDEAALLKKLVEVNAVRCKPRSRAEELQRIASSASKHTVESDKTDLPTLVAQATLDQHFAQGRHLLAHEEHFTGFVGTSLAPFERRPAEESGTFVTGDDPHRKKVKTAAVLTEVATILRAKQASVGDPFFDVTTPPPIINVRNGELHLQPDGSVELKEHSPDSGQRQTMPVEYDPGARCPQYDEALSKIFSKSSDPAELVRHWHELAGYILQPTRMHPAIVVMLGSGSNGKTKLVETILQLMGPEAAYHGARTEAALKTPHGVEVGFRNAQGESKTVVAEALLVAVGRGPVTDGLNLESTKVQVERGNVKTNHLLATDEPSVFAIGDVVALPDRPHPQLAHVASFEGIGVVERLAGHATEALNYDRIPSATYCRPEVAGVGLTEAEAKKRGYDVRVGRFSFGNLAKPRILGHPEGLVKVVAEAKYDEVLGVHIVGPHATDLISEACVALRLEATTEEIFRTVHPHPTLPEALMQAAEAVYGHAIDA